MFFNDLTKIFELNTAYIKKAFQMFVTLIVTSLQIIGLTVDIGGVHNIGDWYSYDFAYSTEKITKTEILGSDDSFKMHLAKNETEGCQFVLRTRYGTQTVYLKIDDFSDGKGNVIPVSVYKESYIKVNVGENINDIQTEDYPDALIPYNNEGFSVEHHTNQPFFIEIATNENTPAGTYTTQVVLTDENGKECIRADISAEVWDFTLPKEAVMDTAFGINTSKKFYDFYGTESGSERATELYKQHYDFLLDHGISAYYLPYDILDSKADAYMSDPRVSSFIIPYSNDDELLQKYYAKVTSNPDWAKKGYFYVVDEPHNSELIEQYEKSAERLARLCPGYKMVTPFSTYFEENGVKYDVLDIESGKSSILCPLTSCYEEKGFYERIEQRKQLGDRSWWYVCCGPRYDHCNFFIQQTGLDHRILFWQQYKYDVTGLLYWSTTYYEGHSINPWLDPVSFVYMGVAGDGVLIYPGPTVGYDGPIASIRLKGIHNGIEDYSYFKLAEKTLGSQKVKDIISEVTKDLTTYTSSDKKFERVRNSLGEAIAATK